MNQRCDAPGKRPPTIPPADDVVRWLDLAGRDMLASSLANWRSGRVLTAAHFEDLRNACFDLIPTRRGPWAWNGFTNNVNPFFIMALQPDSGKVRKPSYPKNMPVDLTDWHSAREPRCFFGIHANGVCNPI